MPQISVVMPVHNTEQYVWEAIESILAQTFEDFEYIIIDDGSTDKSWEIIQQYAQQDHRIKASQNKENRWISFTRNKLIDLSTTNFIASQDSDDISYPHRLHLCYDSLVWDPTCAVVSGTNDIINEWGQMIWTRKYSNNISTTILKKSPLSQPSSMFRKDVFVQIGWYDPDLAYGEDYDLWCKMYVHWYTIKNLDHTLIKHRIRSGQTKSEKVKETLRNTIVIQSRARVRYWLKASLSDYIYNAALRLLLILPSTWIWRLFRYWQYD